MSIIQNVIPFLVPGILIAITQTFIYLRLKKTYQFKFVLFGNLILLGVGVLFSVIGLIVAQGEPGSWAGLGFIILLMVTTITTLISSGASLLMYVILKPTSKK